jgi:hypothetical protein
MGRVVRRQIFLAAALSALFLTPAAARVAPMTPEQQLMLDRQTALENGFRARFGDGALNQLRDMYASVIVADERRGGVTAPRALFKNEYGWHELRANGASKLPRRIAQELDRLMLNQDLWAEPAYVKNPACAAPAVFLLRYGGEQMFGRQCAVEGLSGRVALVAKSLRVPGGRAVTTAPPPGPNDRRASLGRSEDMTAKVSARVREMIYAWERRSLAGAVDPYAENAIVQFEDGRMLRGRAALVQWMRPQQDWSVPGVATQGRTKGVQFQRGTIKAPVGNTITEFREIRWQENGRLLRRTYSATWQNNKGVWEIVHERVSADKPVTGDRQIWP